MKKLLILAALITASCSDSVSSVEGSCTTKQYYSADMNECIDFCEDSNAGLVFNSSTSEYVCVACNDPANKKFVSSINGFCTTCSDTQILVKDNNDAYSCKTISTCDTNIDCSKIANTRCKLDLGYCVNCLNDSHCGIGNFCNSENTCESRKIYADDCTSGNGNECFTGVCNIDLTCGCSTNDQCIKVGDSIGEIYTTCNSGICE